MTKGTPSMGKHNGPATHGICRRCGRHSYFKRKHFCSSCGYGRNTRMRKYGWQTKLRAVDGQKPRNRRTQMAIHNKQNH